MPMDQKTEQGDKCNSLASWDMVCRPKASGGLGVLNLKIQGDALLLKYLHKFYNHSDLPWVELIWSTYYENKIPHTMDACGSFWWRDVAKLMPTFRGITQAQILHGGIVLFWKDLWVIKFYQKCTQELFPSQITKIYLFGNS